MENIKLSERENMELKEMVDKLSGIKSGTMTNTKEDINKLFKDERIEEIADEFKCLLIKIKYIYDGYKYLIDFELEYDTRKLIDNVIGLREYIRFIEERFNLCLHTLRNIKYSKHNLLTDKEIVLYNKNVILEYKKVVEKIFLELKINYNICSYIIK